MLPLIFSNGHKIIQALSKREHCLSHKDVLEIAATAFGQVVSGARLEIVQ
jgi:hypothetical protein